MHSSPTNIPDIKVGDNIRARTLNHLADIAKKNSNSNQSDGMHGHSSSTGTSYNISPDLTKRSFFVMITNGWNDGDMNSFVDGPPTKYGANSGNAAGEICHTGVKTYSWVELKEDKDIYRYGEEIFPINSHPANLKKDIVNESDVQAKFWQPNPTPTEEEKKELNYDPLIKNKIHMQYPGRTPPVPLRDPLTNKIVWAYPFRKACRTVNKESLLEYDEVTKLSKEGLNTTGVRYGHSSTYPLYEINNILLPLGYVMRAYQGQGNYLMCSTPNAYSYFMPYPLAGMSCSIEGIGIPFSSFEPGYGLITDVGLLVGKENGSCCGKYNISIPRLKSNATAAQTTAYNDYIKCIKTYFDNDAMHKDAKAYSEVLPTPYKTSSAGYNFDIDPYAYRL